MKQVLLEYHGLPVPASREAWFNATEVAALFGKKPFHWLRLPDTERYIQALCKRYEVRKSHFIKTSRGKGKNGTWLHPKLAVAFARWLDIDFAVWCDEQIEKLLTERPQWQTARDDTKAYTKLVNMMLEQSRLAEGKAVKAHHFINESLMLNEALTGRREPLNRDALTPEQLKQLTCVISADIMAIGRGAVYQERKALINRLLQGGRGLQTRTTAVRS